MQILVADDHELARFAICEVLKRIEPEAEIMQCDNLEVASTLAAEKGDLDLIVVDLVMPGMSGVDDVTPIQNLHPQTPVAIISGQFSRKDVVRALQIGAAGFISKTLGLKGLENAFRVILAGDKYIPVELMSFDNDASGEGDEKDNDSFPNLSKRQRQVLNGLVNGRTNRSIASALDISEATVKLHVSGILRKLGAKNRTDAATMAMDRGWKQIAVY